MPLTILGCAAQGKAKAVSFAQGTKTISQQMEDLRSPEGESSLLGGVQSPLRTTNAGVDDSLDSPFAVAPSAEDTALQDISAQDFVVDDQKVVEASSVDVAR